jgi:hypothetical protein
MSGQSGLSRLQMLFEAALQDYENQTDIELVKHPLAEQLHPAEPLCIMPLFGTYVPY